MFSKEFYRQLQNNPFFKVSLDDLAVKLTSYITNDSVKLDASRIQVVDYEDENNNKVGKIIKNLKLSRTQDTIVHLQMVCLHRASQQIS